MGRALSEGPLFPKEVCPGTLLCHPWAQGIALQTTQGGSSLHSFTHSTGITDLRQDPARCWGHDAGRNPPVPVLKELEPRERLEINQGFT